MPSLVKPIAAQVTFSITYGVVTPESAEHGDYAETGYEVEDATLEANDGSTLIDAAADLIEHNLGFVDCSHVLSSLDEHATFYQVDPDIDYSDASETTRAAHFQGFTKADMEALVSELKRRRCISIF